MPNLDLLKSAHRADNLAAVMCRDLISIDCRGTVYGFNFNQMLDLPLQAPDHCYGCTAGQRSSCSGALALAS
jgi:hypothetical protein